MKSEDIQTVITAINQQIKSLEEKREVLRKEYNKLAKEEQLVRTRACKEHHYLPYGQYASGRKCQFCGDEIGTTF